MAYMCRKSPFARECDGCGACQQADNGERYYCPTCGHELDYDETVYLADLEVVGCPFCVEDADGLDTQAAQDALEPVVPDYEELADDGPEWNWRREE